MTRLREYRGFFVLKQDITTSDCIVSAAFSSCKVSVAVTNSPIPHLFPHIVFGEIFHTRKKCAFKRN
jgi:hypothetical protein